ncbi:MAG: sigma factor-like helix-turn-helix DNA-binding protein [Patescibacteria group bacterium]
MSKNNLNLPGQGAVTKTVASLVKGLSTRNKDIISRRFGLKNGRKETLESIGKSYGITRERVRQIEEFTLNQLSKGAPDPEVEKYATLAKNILNENGGVMKEKDLFKAFSGSDTESVLNSSLVFVLTLDKNLTRFNDNDDFHSFWAADNNVLSNFKNMASSCANLLEKSGKVTMEGEFYNLAKNNNVSGLSGDLNPRHLTTYLTISKGMGKNIFNEVGLVSWPEIRPKGVKDKAYLVLKKENSPKHFGEIAKLINAAGFQGKKANVQTVHNELIKDDRFVLVGRGMYALSEWGYKSGTVKDVLVDLLKNSSKPMLKTALLTKVMNARMVKENTILLNLQDSRTFVKNEDGTYSLRQA